MVAFFMGILHEPFGKSLKGYIVSIKIGGLKLSKKHYVFPATFLNIKRPFWKKESKTILLSIIGPFDLQKKYAIT